MSTGEIRARSDAEVERAAPPAGEEIHIPGPSLIPFLSAIGITLMVVGTTINWLFSLVGLVIFVLTTIRWIKDTRRDIDALPEGTTSPPVQ